MDNVDITISLDYGLREKLSQLAAITKRSEVVVIADMVAAGIDRELALMKDLRRSVESSFSLGSGRVISHQEAMKMLEDVIKKTS
ncbi:MAG: hypothetical protein AMR96_06345 [Candidatus Adiutrix intracellularis]|jgi:predicted transcriptional regulator|nr:MAG: hypothetical protein AMR96_06345 [Candidatus Adiutrix intracellularis]MDR2826489.1 hypothetical protein [Candidatus Adiutrix intracellularis]